MRISHVINSIDESSGGISTCLSTLTCQLAIESTNYIHTITSPQPISFDPNVELLLSKNDFESIPLSFSSGFKQSLKITSPNLVHAHGLWQLTTHYAVKYGVSNNIPVIISPHGMLEPGALKFSPIKKQLASFFWQKRDLSKASCIHVTSVMEAENCRNFGISGPIAIIPNGIQLDDYPSKVKSSHSHKKTKRTLLFLSRIHAKKGLDILLNTWNKLSSYHNDWQLIIAGTDDGGYESQLKTLASNLNLSWSESLEDENVSLYFVGPVFGKEKIDLYQNADLFVLPTRSENFGMVIAESLACGTPVITTSGAPWEDLIQTNSGWWVDIGEVALNTALKDAFSRSNKQLFDMGVNGRKLIIDKYSIESSARNMKLLYDWCLSGSRKPNFVV
ncbi:glycosyltransferase [Vibrio cortegadensis]|uniref:glycosyltransferase n=1 Tax=Vibrio cortegadensis TaxID=1328770 RepID=UPI00352DC853